MLFFVGLDNKVKVKQKSVTETQRRTTKKRTTKQWKTKKRTTMRQWTTQADNTEHRKEER